MRPRSRNWWARTSTRRSRRPIWCCHEVTQPTSDALVKVMAKNPADRFLSYDEFISVLEASRSQLLIQQYNQPDSPKPKSKTSWWRR